MTAPTSTELRYSCVVWADEMASWTLDDASGCHLAGAIEPVVGLEECLAAIARLRLTLPRAEVVVGDDASWELIAEGHTLMASVEPARDAAAARELAEHCRSLGARALVDVAVDVRDQPAPPA